MENTHKKFFEKFASYSMEEWKKHNRFLNTTIFIEKGDEFASVFTDTTPENLQSLINSIVSDDVNHEITYIGMTYSGTKRNRDTNETIDIGVIQFFDCCTTADDNGADNTMTQEFDKEGKTQITMWRNTAPFGFKNPWADKTEAKKLVKAKPCGSRKDGHGGAYIEMIGDNGWKFTLHVDAKGNVSEDRSHLN